MPTSDKHNRRRIITVAVILAAALAGLFIINTDRAAADRTQGPATSTEMALQEGAAHDASGLTPTSVVPSLFKMVSALVVVIICIYGGIYLLKRLMGRRYSGNRRHSVLEVLETTYVAPKKTISLVRVADKSVLVGVTESQITVLTELDAAKTAEIVSREAAQTESENFKSMLSTASRKVREFTLKRRGPALEAVVKTQQQ